jgi:hypothetical protein
MRLTKFDAGEEINTGERLELLNADFDDLDDNGERVYPDTDRGYKRWEREQKRYREYKRNAKELLSALLLHMEREVKDKV